MTSKKGKPSGESPSRPDGSVGADGDEAVLRHQKNKLYVHIAVYLAMSIGMSLAVFIMMYDVFSGWFEYFMVLFVVKPIFNMAYGFAGLYGFLFLLVLSLFGVIVHGMFVHAYYRKRIRQHFESSRRIRLLTRLLHSFVMLICIAINLGSLLLLAVVMGMYLD